VVQGTTNGIYAWDLNQKKSIDIENNVTQGSWCWGAEFTQDG
jgi:hypothetical protein